jgi:hypothetical protein
MVTGCVLFEVRTECLDDIQRSSGFKGLIFFGICVSTYFVNFSVSHIFYILFRIIRY